MKVEYAPFAVFADQDRGELSILSGGIRIEMTGTEASKLWAEISTALRRLYVDRPEHCPSEFTAFLRGQIADTDAESITALARPARPSTDAEMTSASLSGTSRPADTAFRRLVRDTFEKKRSSQ